MRQIPSKMRINAMVTIVSIVFEIVGGGGGALTFSNTPDLIGLTVNYISEQSTENSIGSSMVDVSTNPPLSYSA